MIYLDTSVLVTLHTPETGSGAAIDAMAAYRDQDFAVSFWSLTEFASALSRKVLMGRLTSDDRSRAQAEFSLFCESMTILDLQQADFHFAAQIMQNDAESGLRAGDALHLAVVMRMAAELATFDHTLALAASQLGVSLADAFG